MNSCFARIASLAPAWLPVCVLTACGGGGGNGGEATYAVGGVLSGLTGSGLVLRDNGGDDLAVSAAGAFTFATKVATGAPYAVAVYMLLSPSIPAGHSCM